MRGGGWGIMLQGKHRDGHVHCLSTSTWGGLEGQELSVQGVIIADMNEVTSQ